MTHREISKMLGCPVPTSIEELAEMLEPRDSEAMLELLTRSLPVYKDIRKRLMKRVAGLTDQIWDVLASMRSVATVVHSVLVDPGEADQDFEALCRDVQRMRDPLSRSTVASRTRRSTGRAARRTADGEPVSGLDPGRLLTPLERSCASAITGHWALMMGAACSVADFRARAFGGAARCLTPDEADEFIASPLVRSATFAEIDRIGISPCVAGSTVLDWTKADFVETDALPPVNSKGVRRAPGVGLSAPYSRIDSYQISVPCRPEPLSGKVISRAGATLQSIPFLPIDCDRYDDNTTFPLRLPGSVADVLGNIAAAWSSRLPWDAWEIAYFIVTGDLQSLRPLRCEVHRTADAMSRYRRHLPMDGVTDREAFTATAERQRRMGSQDVSVRGSVELWAEPWVSEATVAKCYAEARAISMEMNRPNRKGSGWRWRATAATPDSGRGRVRLPTAATCEAVVQAAANALQGSSKDRRSLRSILSSTHAEYSNALKTLRTALDVLDLEANPRGLVEAQDERKRANVT